jgi:hypothetical protein
MDHLKVYSNMFRLLNIEPSSGLIIPFTQVSKKIYEWTLIERKKRGRPRNTWKKKAKQAMDGRNLREEDYLDRNRWRLGCGIRARRL